MALVNKRKGGIQKKGEGEIKEKKITKNLCEPSWDLKEERARKRARGGMGHLDTSTKRSRNQPNVDEGGN